MKTGSMESESESELRSQRQKLHSFGYNPQPHYQMSPNTLAGASQQQLTCRKASLTMSTVVNKSKKEQSNLKTKEWAFKSSKKFRPKLFAVS